MANKLTSITGFGEGDPKPENRNRSLEKIIKTAGKNMDRNFKHLAKSKALSKKSGEHPHHKGLSMSSYKSQMKEKGYASHKGFAVKDPKSGKYPSPNV